MGKGINFFGGNGMSEKYWEYFKMYKDSGISTEQAMIKAHDAVYAGF